LRLEPRRWGLYVKRPERNNSADPVGTPAARERAGRKTFIGLLLVTAGTLMQEVLLTRVFSVTMWYHFAFLAVSLAMFGMTIGALAVYLRPEAFVGLRLRKEITAAAALFSISAALSILIHLNVPLELHRSVSGFASLAFNYLLMAAPFFFSGVCVCAVLTGFPDRISSLYATDLVGAALGCVVVLFSLSAAGVAGSVFAVGLSGAAAAWCFAADAGLLPARRTALWLGAAFLLFVAGNSIAGLRGESLFRLRWAKGRAQSRPLFEKWNSFSRVAVWGDPNRPIFRLGEGISPTYKPDRPMRVLPLTIDENAETDLIDFEGDWSRLNFLRYDVKNLCYWVRPRGKVFIIGAGGGRDVLSAMLFGAQSVRALEVNPAVLDALLHRFGDFAGHLDRYPGVTFVNDEARSYIARDREKYDVIEASFVDTWAATAAGGLALTENSLYTVDAWKLFLSRLNPRGVLSFSRWYIPNPPGEVYRLVSLAAAALRETGVPDPRAHIVVVANRPLDGSVGAATILVSPSSFSPADLAQIEQVAARMKFTILVSPPTASDPVFAELAGGEYRGGAAAQLPLNLAPPTDDNPFFFSMISFPKALDRHLWSSTGTLVFNMVGVYLLEALLAVVVLLTLACIFLPLVWRRGQEIRMAAAPHLVYFAAIGLGFMLIEMSAMERLVVFLGSPTYTLSVVLFTVLLASGLGSYSTRAVPIASGGRAVVLRLLFLIATLLVCGLLGARLIAAFAASGTLLRAGVAVAWLFPMAFFMGMAFPLGFRLVALDSPALTPWMWGINGAASVVSSVLAVAIAMEYSISSGFWVGVASYAVATAAFTLALRARTGLPQLAGVALKVAELPAEPIETPARRAGARHPAG